MALVDELFGTTMILQGRIIWSLLAIANLRGSHLVRSPYSGLAAAPSRQALKTVLNN